MKDLKQLHATVVKAREDAEANCGCDWGIFCKKCGDAAIAERTLLDALLDANAVEALMELYELKKAQDRASESGQAVAIDKLRVIADQLDK